VTRLILVAVLLLGGCTTVDQYAPRELGVQAEPGSVDWKKVGRAAGWFAGAAIRLALHI